MLSLLFASSGRLSRPLRDEVQRLRRDDVAVLVREDGDHDADVAQDDREGILGHLPRLAALVAHLVQVAQVLHELLVLVVIGSHDPHPRQHIVDHDVQLGLLPPRELQLASSLVGFLL